MARGGAVLLLASDEWRVRPAWSDERATRPVAVTLAGVGNDVRAAAEHLAGRFHRDRVGVVGASFSGGVCALLAAHRPDLVDRLVLFNPLLDYKHRFVDQKDYWTHDRIDPAHGEQLDRDGFVAHSPTFKLGRALLNEVFWLDARVSLPSIAAPTLLVHGTGDTFLPVESSRTAAAALTCRNELLELEGAQHGFAVHDDPTYQEPRTQRWQAAVIAATAGWLTDSSEPLLSRHLQEVRDRRDGSVRREPTAE